MHEKSFIKEVAAQSTAILLAALGAGLIAFVQSLATSSGVCPVPAPDPAEAGSLGALFKGAHSAFLLRRGTIV